MFSTTYTFIFIFYYYFLSTSCQNSKTLPIARDQINLLTQIKKIHMILVKAYNIQYLSDIRVF